MNKQEPTPGRWLRALTEVYVVALTLGIYPYTVDAATDLKRLITVWSVLLLALGYLVALLRKRIVARPPGILGGIVAVYVGYTLFAALYSPHRAYAFTQWTTSAMHAVLYLVVAQLYSSVAQVRRLMIVTCAAVAISSLYGFSQYAGYDPFPWAQRTTEEYRHLPSTFGNPNYAGHTLILALTMVVGLGWSKGSRRYLLLGVPIGLHFLMTGMRSGRIALAAAALLIIFTYLAYRWTQKRARAVPLAIAGTVIAGLLGVVLLLAVYRIQSGRSLPLDPSLLLRYNSYYGASKMVLNHPLAGFGPGAYVIENPPYWTGYEQLWFATESKVNEHVHNDLLEEAVSAGLPAAGLYLAFLLSAIFQSLSMALATAESARRPLAFAMAAFFTAFIMDGLFGFNLHVPVSAPLLFVMAGVLEGLSFNSQPLAAPRRAMTPLYAAAAGFAILGAVLGTGNFLASYNMYYGEVYADHKEHKRALSYFAAAHDWTPWKWEPLCAMGQSARGANQLDDAIVWLKQSLARNPNHLPALDALARAYADRAARGAAQSAAPANPEADLRDAEAAADRVIELCPGLSETIECRGRINSLQAVIAMRSGKESAVSTGFWKQARTQLETAAKLGTRNRSRVQRMLAEACIALSDADAAQSAFARSIEATPDDETLRAFLSFAAKTNRYPAFVDLVNAAIAHQRAQRSPDRGVIVRLYLTLADAHGNMRAGDRDGENGALVNALALAPGRYDLWARYARFQDFQLPPLKSARESIVRRGEATEEIPAPIDAILRDPAASARDLSLAVTAAGQACLNSAKNSPPEMLRQNFIWIANALRSQISAVAGNDSEKGKALRALAPLFAALKEGEAADQILTTAESLLSGVDRVYCLLEHADLLVQHERYQEAVTAAERARALAPDHPLVMFGLARAYASADRRTEAKAILDTLMNIPRLEKPLREQVEQEAARLR